MTTPPASQLNPTDRYASDTRTLLDLTAHELRRLNLPAGTRVGVFTASPELLEDLQARLDDHFNLISGTGAAQEDVQLHFWTAEQSPAQWQEAMRRARHILVAYRNRLSHRTLVNRAYQGVNAPQLEGQLARTHRIRASWGVLPPTRVAWLAASALANRARRYDLGYALADRALLAPTERGPLRYLCPQGLIVGSREGGRA